MTKDMQEQDWVELIPENQVWKPEEIGAEIIGIYVKKEEKVGAYEKTRYTLETKEGDRQVYATTDIQQKMAMADLGDCIKIILKKTIPQKAPRSPFKMFQVFHKPGKAVNKAEGNDKAEGQASNMADEDDPEARETINLILKELQGKPTAGRVVNYALKVKKDWELTDEDITRIKVQAVKMVDTK
jgi:hypothetical protein